MKVRAIRNLKPSGAISRDRFGLPGGTAQVDPTRATSPPPIYILHSTQASNQSSNHLCSTNSNFHTLHIPTHPFPPVSHPLVQSRRSQSPTYSHMSVLYTGDMYTDVSRITLIITCSRILSHTTLGHNPLVREQKDTVSFILSHYIRN